MKVKDIENPLFELGSRVRVSDGKREYDATVLASYPASIVVESPDGIPATIKKSHILGPGLPAGMKKFTYQVELIKDKTSLWFSGSSVGKNQEEAAKEGLVAIRRLFPARDAVRICGIEG